MRLAFRHRPLAEIRGHESILERIIAEGHELGNHTFGHPHTSALRRSDVREELVVRRFTPFQRLRKMGRV